MYLFLCRHFDINLGLLLKKLFWLTRGRMYFSVRQSVAYAAMLQGGCPIFGKTGIEKRREMICKEEGLDPQGNCHI